MRFSAVFTAACLVITATAIAAIAFLSFGFTAVETIATALTVLTLLTAYNLFAGRAQDRADVGHRIADLSRGTADLARQVGELGRRVIALETAVGHVDDKIHMAKEPLSAEIEVLGTLVNQLAESVAAHEAALVGAVNATKVPAGAATAPRREMPAPGSAPRIAPEPAVPAAAATAAAPATDRAGGGRFEDLPEDEMVGLIRGALEANRLDLYLQPIVTLPQRKVRYYEAMTRLRTAEGELLAPPDYLSHAENGGLMPLLDNLVLFRCVQVVRRLTLKNREVGLFCNIAGSTLVDSDFFPQFSEFLANNRALAPSLVFEFAQGAVRSMGAIEHASLAALAQLGFRFSMDRVADFTIAPRELAEQGFRFVKVPAALLLNRASAAGADIHPADFSNLLARYGIDLIAEKIETEGTVVDLLDYDIKLGQGFLFSAPRPVRAEVFQGAAARPPRPQAADFPVLGEAGAGEAEPAMAAARQRAAATPAPAPVAAPAPSALAKLARDMARRA